MMQKQGPDTDIMDSIPVQSIRAELMQNPWCIALILFGSVARGESRAISDIDLCVITQGNTPEPELMNLLSYGSERIDMSLFSSLPLTLRFRVIKEGKILFCKDTLALHRIKADTIREYLDIAPLIRRQSLHFVNSTG